MKTVLQISLIVWEVKTIPRDKKFERQQAGDFWSFSINNCLHAKIFIIIGLEHPVALACGLISCLSLGRFSILLLVNYSDLSKQAGLTKHLKKVSRKTIILCGMFSMLWVIPAGLFAIIFMIIFGYASIYFFSKFVVPFNRGLSGDILGLYVVFVEISSLLILTASFSQIFH